MRNNPVSGQTSNVGLWAFCAICFAVLGLVSLPLWSIAWWFKVTTCLGLYGCFWCNWCAVMERRAMRRERAETMRAAIEWRQTD